MLIVAMTSGLQAGATLRLLLLSSGRELLLYWGSLDRVSHGDAQDQAFPRGKAQLQGGEPRPMTQRSSHIYYATSRPMPTFETRKKKKTKRKTVKSTILVYDPSKGV